LSGPVAWRPGAFDLYLDPVAITVEADNLHVDLRGF
jgi:hypothetical protein